MSQGKTFLKVTIVERIVRTVERFVEVAGPVGAKDRDAISAMVESEEGYGDEEADPETGDHVTVETSWDLCQKAPHVNYAATRLEEGDEDFDEYEWRLTPVGGAL